MHKWLGRLFKNSSTIDKRSNVYLEVYKNLEDWRGLLERYAPEYLPRPKAGFFTNFFGVMTDIMLYSNRPGFEDLSGKIFSDVPIPGDMHHVGADEYGSFFLAVENRAKNDRFTVVEVGAGWGPWISAAGVVGKRLGIKKLDLVGVEADARKVEYMRLHLANNHLIDDENVQISLINGAAWTSNSEIFFGADTNFTDYAAAAVNEPGSTDYLGRSIEFIKMQGLTLETIVGERQSVDYMAVDIQGAEFDVLSHSVDLLNSKVRILSVGTHSPAIHGKLIEFFFKHRWHIAWDKYPDYKYDLNKSELAGMLITDGELVLMNSQTDGSH